MQPISLSIDGQRSEASTAPLGDMAAPARSLYAHVPFCSHKCHYCDFYSFVDTREQQRAFTEAMLLELDRLGAANEAAGASENPTPLRTIFVGGGTPSLLRPDLWDRLLERLERRFDLSEIRAGRGEFTVECNPESTTPELLATLRAGGVDRLSVGAQSFARRHLATLERRHDPDRVEAALRLAREAGIRRRSLDLIFGVPGQTLDDWMRDLDAALSLEAEGEPLVEHLSCYALTYEPNTPMTARLHAGQFEPVDDDDEADMQRATVERLARVGFERYEVSNFARGSEAASLHNLAYWRDEAWLAAGPSASGHVFARSAGADPDAFGAPGHRWKNVPRLGAWMRGVHAGGGAAIVVEHEPPHRGRAMRERLMMQLRLSEGVDEGALLAACAALGEERPLARAVGAQIDLGRLERVGGRLAATDEGFLMLNDVTLALMDAMPDAD